LNFNRFPNKSKQKDSAKNELFLAVPVKVGRCWKGVCKEKNNYNVMIRRWLWIYSITKLNAPSVEKYLILIAPCQRAFSQMGTYI
jgi:hypothetical protein